MKQRHNQLRVEHNAPGKRGKREVRYFDSLADATAYIERNAAGRLRERKGLSRDEAMRDLSRISNGRENG